VTTVAELIQRDGLIVVCGSGGVGKTTVSAALGVLAATQTEKRVLVLTVDPAKRLANALGLSEFGNVEVQITSDLFKTSKTKLRGSLSAAMIDTKASWDDLISRHAPDEATRNSVLQNSLYKNLTERFVHSHDYIAIERLYQAHSCGAYDLIIVDTPPSRNALTVLDAPKRMQDFFSSRLLKILTANTQWQLLALAAKPFYEIADRLLGKGLLRDVAEFFTLFRTMETGFVERAKKVEALLHDNKTSFAIVTTLEDAPLCEAEFLGLALKERKFSTNLAIANRIIPKELHGQALNKQAQVLNEALQDTELMGLLKDLLLKTDSTSEIDEENFTKLLTQTLETVQNYAQATTQIAEKQSVLLERVAGFADHFATAPMLETDIADINGLVALGENLNIV
jgi:anion-transporting  ArsA/GET3 family ATPase